MKNAHDEYVEVELPISNWAVGQLLGLGALSYVEIDGRYKLQLTDRGAAWTMDWLARHHECARTPSEA